MNSFLYNNYRYFYYLLITNPILLIEKSWVAVSSFIGIDVTIGKGAVLNQYHQYKHVKKLTLVVKKQQNI